MDSKRAAKGVLYLRVPVTVKERLRRYADRFGITDAAAAAILLTQALDAAEEQK